MEKKLETELAAVRPKVLALARKFFRAASMDADPEDVVQDVLLRLWEARQSGASIRNAEAWAVMTTKNSCISLWRKSRKDLRIPLPETASSGDLPSRKLDESEAESELLRAMERIPQSTRYLLQLRSRGLSLDEMAALTGRSKGSVKSSISIARKEVLKTLKA